MEMELACLLGLACRDFILIAADTTQFESILVIKDDKDKICQLSSNVLMATCGKAGDCTMFSELIAKNAQLYKMRNGYELSTKEVATFTRRKIAEYLRSMTLLEVNMLIAGYDDKLDSFELYHMDYLGAMVKVPLASHGFGGMFSMGIMERCHRDDLSIEEGVEILTRCVEVIQKRLAINLSAFKVKVITRGGVQELGSITSTKIALRSDCEEKF